MGNDFDKVFKDLFDTAMDNRIYQSFSDNVKGDKNAEKLIRIIKYVADRHGMKFIDLEMIILEITMLMGNQE